MEKQTPILDGLWTEDQAAAFLVIAPKTLRHYRRTRALPCLRISNKAIRYRRQEIEAWLDGQRNAAGGKDA